MPFHLIGFQSITGNRGVTFEHHFARGFLSFGYKKKSFIFILKFAPNADLYEMQISMSYISSVMYAYKANDVHTLLHGVSIERIYSSRPKGEI